MKATPTSFQYQLTSTSGSVNYAISGIPTWLNANFTSGTATTTPVTVTFTLINPGTLTPGTYTATIAFTNTSNGQGNTTRSATLTVTTVPFSAFSIAQLSVYPNQPGFALNSNFTLGATSNGINPLTEPIALKIGSFAITIPAGSFVMAGPGYFTFVGVIDNVNLTKALPSEIKTVASSIGGSTGSSPV